MDAPVAYERGVVSLPSAGGGCQLADYLEWSDRRLLVGFEEHLLLEESVIGREAPGPGRTHAAVGRRPWPLWLKFIGYFPRTFWCRLPRWFTRGFAAVLTASREHGWFGHGVRWYRHVQRYSRRRCSTKLRGRLCKMQGTLRSKLQIRLVTQMKDQIVCVPFLQFQNETVEVNAGCGSGNMDMSKEIMETVPCSPQDSVHRT